MSEEMPAGANTLISVELSPDMAGAVRMTVQLSTGLQIRLNLPINSASVLGDTLVSLARQAAAEQAQAAAEHKEAN